MTVKAHFNWRGTLSFLVFFIYIYINHLSEAKFNISRIFFRSLICECDVFWMWKRPCWRLMAQGNSSGQHLNVHVGSNICWAAGEINTRQGKGRLVSGSWLAALQRQRNGSIVFWMLSSAFHFPPLLYERSHGICVEKPVIASSSAWLQCLRQGWRNEKCYHILFYFFLCTTIFIWWKKKSVDEN